MSAIPLTEKQLDGKPRKVGTLNSNPVFHVKTKGGWQIISDHAGKILGVGPHRGVAMNIAEKNAKGLEWNLLAKGDWVDPSHYQWLLPRWIEITNAIRALQ